MRFGWSVTIVATLMLAGRTSAQAGIIDEIAPAQDFTNGNATARDSSITFAVTVKSNNDDAIIDDPNSAENSVEIFDSLAYTSIGPVDVVFSVENSGSVTEYVIWQVIQNTSLSDWIGFRLQLGFGTGPEFTPSLADDGLDFDWDTLTGFFDLSELSDAEHYEDDIIWSGGTWEIGLFASLYITIDVPDSDTIPGAGASGYTFTLRQTPLLSLDLESPVIPEPTTGAALGLALAWIGGRRRRSLGHRGS